MIEKWDAYDRNRNKIENVTLYRNQDIPSGMYHLECEITVSHSDGSILLMKRDQRKKYGGLWESTAGGSAILGEDVFECIIRELKEETGIEIYKNELIEVGSVTNEKNKSILVYFWGKTNCDKNAIVLQEGETVDYVWKTKQEILEMKEELIDFGTLPIIERFG